MIKLEGFSQLQLLDKANHRLVYRGVDDKMGQTVIIKYIVDENLHKQAAYRLRHEYDVCRQFTGPEAANALRLECCGDGLQIVFRDYGGESLNKLIKRKRLNMRKVLEMAVKIVDSIAEVHSRNIIHKDIKPSNIVYNQNENSMQIIDFGICRQITREKPTISNPRTLEGSLAYMAPEQTGRMNRTVDYRADFYSLGVTLYEMFTGVKPFNEDDPLELVYCHIAVPPKSMRAINDKVPLQVEKIVSRLMCKLAEDRYQGAWGIKSDLEECLSQLDIHGQIRNFTLAVHDVPEMFQLPQKMVGRDESVEQLLDTFSMCRKGKKGLTLISGDAGMGKTTVVNEIYKSITKSKGSFVFGKFEQMQKNIPYSALVAALRELVTNLLSEPESTLKSWRDKLLDGLGSSRGVIVEVIPEMRFILGGQPELAEGGLGANQNRLDITLLKLIHVFCTEVHPVVIFLDNMQWADNATLQLLELVSKEEHIGYLYIVGAYRHDDTTALYSVIHLKNEWHENKQIVNELELKPLSVDQVNELLADALFKDLDSTVELARLVRFKTGGNPFFIEQFLKTLYEDNLLFFHQNWGAWSWNIEEVEQREITDNVVSLMAGKIKSLPKNIQEDMKLAACIGNRFCAKTLMSLSGKSKEETIESLKVAIAQGLIVAESDFFCYMLGDQEEGSGNVNLRFLHGRIQQAAYSLLNEDLRTESHLRIARILSDCYKDDLSGNRIFDIASHYVMGQSVIQNNEKSIFLGIMLKAASKARSTAAYDSAYQYIQSALSFVDDGAWREHYARTLSLFNEAAIIYHAIGDFEGMHTIVDAGLDRAISPIESTQFYELKILMHETLKQYDQAVTAVIDALKLLGVTLDPMPGQFRIFWTCLKLKTGLTCVELVHLGEGKELDRIEIQMAHRIMLKASATVYLGAPKVIPMMIFKGISLMRQYGFCTEASVQYSVWGGVALCGMLGKIEEGYQISKQAIGFCDEDTHKEYIARIHFFHHSFVSPWKCHLRESVKGLLKGYHSGVEIGDRTYAANCIAFHFFHRFLCGGELPRLSKELIVYQDIVSEFKEEAPLHMIRLTSQVLQTFQGDWDSFDELKKGITDISDNATRCSAYTNSLLLAYHFGHFEQAVEWADKAAELVDSVLGTSIVPLFYFYDCLSRIEVYRRRNRWQQIKYHRLIKRSLKKMALWSKHCPDNFSHRYWLMKAEYERELGGLLLSMDAFDKSIDLAKKHGYTCELGLAQERAAHFYLELGKASPAQAYAKDASRTYRHWGAVGKTDYVDNEFQAIIKHKYELFNVTSDHSELVTRRMERVEEELDFTAVMRSSQAISSEINLPNLLVKVITTVMQIGGATRALYLSCQGEEAFVEVETDVRGSRVHATRTGIMDFDRIPKTLIQYVFRTREVVALNDACTKNIFERDAYIREFHPRSIVCLPVLINKKLEAILYLEHNELSSVFTPTRNETLQMLAMQAGISVQNARYYTAVEESERKYRSLFDNASEGFFQIDNDQSYKLVNQAFARILGYANIDVFMRSERKPSDFYKHKGDYQIFEERLIKEGEVNNFEVKGIGADEREFDVLINAYVVDYGGDRVIEGLMRDITERKRMESMRLAKEAAELSVKTKSEFLANVSHEIRTPMNAFIGFTDLVASTQLDSDQADYVKKIQTSSRVLLGVINDILDYSSIEAGKLELEQVEFDIDELLGELLDLFAATVTEKGIDLIAYVDPHAPRKLIGDPFRLSQILINLVSNAVKFTSKGQVVVRVTQGDKPTAPLHADHEKVIVRFSVHDSGIGINEEQRETLFDSFSQGDSSIRRKYGGTGLGLSICRHLVSLMEGHIGVTGAIGEGCDFYFNAYFGGVEEIPGKDDVSTAFENRHVVLIHDNEVCRNILTQQFQDWGARTTVCKSEAELNTYLNQMPAAMLGGERLDTANSEIYIVNHRLGLKSGLNVVDRLLLYKAGCKNQCLYMLPFGLTETKKTVRMSGLDHIVNTPISALPLRKAVALLLGQLTSEAPLGIIVRSNNVRSNNASYRGMKALLVDDNVINRQVGAAMLKSHGFEVEYSENGQQAIEKITRISYDIVFMDIQMPIMDGHEAIALIRREASSAKLVVVAMTATALDGDEQDCLNSGFTGYLAKPVNKQSLLEGLQKWLKVAVSHGEEPPAAANLACADGFLSDAVMDYPGLDVSRGVDRLNGDVRVYVSLLKVMHTDFETSANQIHAALEQGEVKKALQISHSLKGVAGNLSAQDVYLVATKIDDALELKELFQIDTLLGQLDASMKEVAVSIDGLEKATLETKTVDPENGSDVLNMEEMEALLQELSALLGDNDLESESCFKKLKAILRQSEVSVEVDNLANCLDRYDFEGALEFVDVINRRLKF